MRKLWIFLIVFAVVVGIIVGASFIAPSLVQTYLVNPVNGFFAWLVGIWQAAIVNPWGLGTSLAGIGAAGVTVGSKIWNRATSTAEQAATQKQTQLHTIYSSSLNKVVTEKDKQIEGLTNQLTELQSTSVAKLNSEIETMKQEHIKTVNSIDAQLRQARIERDTFKSLFEKAQEKLPQEIHVE